MDNEVSNTFFEVQAEKFYQKKVEVARGVIELGQILKETRDGLNDYHKFEQWLQDKRVGFKRVQACKYIKIYEELGDSYTTSVRLDDLSLNKLYTLASAPEEVKEDVANSKDKEEAEKKIKEYEERLKQEKLAREALIKNNLDLQEQLDKEKKTKKVEYREIPTAPDDYEEVKCKSEQYEEERKKNVELGKMISDLQEEKMNIRYEYDKRIREVEEKYHTIQEQLKEMDLEEEKLYKYVRQDRDVGQFVGDVQVLLLDKLASFKFSAYLDDDITKYSVDMLAKLINQIRRWCNEMESMLEKYTEEFEEQENRDDGNIIEIENVEVS